MKPRYIDQTNEYFFNGRYFEADDPEQIDFLVQEIERQNEIDEDNDDWDREIR
jgi:hypothetical protein